MVALSALFAITKISCAALAAHLPRFWQPSKDTLSPRHDVNTGASDVTNAQRFAQGLAPLPPRKLYEPPTRVGALRPRASGPATITGNIIAVNVNSPDSILSTPPGSFTLTVADKMLTLEDALANPYGYPFCGYYSFVGASPDLRPGTSDFAIFISRSPDPRTQCNIWTYDAATQVLTATWVNSDQSTASELALLDGQSTALPDLVADYAYVEAISPGEYRQVLLKLIPTQ